MVNDFGKKRLQFDFTHQALEELDELRDEMGLTSRVDVIRNALKLLQLAVKARIESNARVLLESQQQTCEVVLPFFLHARRVSRPASLAADHSEPGRPKPRSRERVDRVSATT